MKCFLTPNKYTKFDFASRKEIVISSGSGREYYSLDLNRVGLRRHIPDQFITDSNLLRLIYQLYMYTLRLSDTTDIKKLRFLSKEDASSIRLAVFSSFDLVSYKIATLRCFYRRLKPSVHMDKIIEMFKAEGLSRYDAILYCLLYHNDLHAFADLISKIEDDSEPFLLSSKTLTLEVSEPATYKKFRNWASSVTARKLEFIYSGNRYEHTDLQNELVTRACQAYYWVRPFYSKAHAANYATAAINGYSQILITHYTHPDRQRTFATATGYDNTIIGITENEPGLAGFCEDSMLTYIDLKRTMRNEHLLHELETVAGSRLA